MKVQTEYLAVNLNNNNYKKINFPVVLISLKRMLVHWQGFMQLSHM